MPKSRGYMELWTDLIDLAKESRPPNQRHDDLLRGGKVADFL
jgi:hypothetical protein